MYITYIPGTQSNPEDQDYIAITTTVEANP